MPYDPLQLQTDVDFITSQPQWQDEKTRREYIRQVGVQAKGNLDNEAHTELMNTLWGKMDTRGKLQKAGQFVGTAVGEVVKSIPATFGAVGTALGDIAGVTDTGSGARLKAGVSGLVDTAGQRLKQLAPNDRQEQRDMLIESLREDIDKGAVPQGFEKWLAGEYDNKEIDDPETKAFVDAVVSGISRASVAADHMGDIDAYKLRSFMESDRSPFRSDSDLSGEMGARQFLADYVATRDPQSWQQFKDRVTETDAQYRNRLRVYVAQKPRTEEVLASMPEGLEKEMVQRSLSMQESPIDLASALVPAVRGAKALQAAKAGGFGAAAGRFAKGAAIEGAQEAGTEALQDPRATAAQIAEAGALGAVGAGALEAGAAGIGAAARRIGGAPAAAPTTPETPAPVAPTAAESVTVESGEMPLPTVLKTLDEKVKAAVDANADVLPATAAALKETAPEPVVEETVVAEAPAAPAAPVVEEAVVTETPAQEESPAAPPAEPTDATEGQPPTPGGVGAPPVVTNEPQTPSPAEQPVSAAQTPVATEPEAPLPETEKVVAPKAEPEQGAGMIATREQSYTTDERENFTKIPRGSRRDRFVISPVTGVVFDRLFSTSVTPPAFSKTEEAVKALNESAYNDNIPVPVALGQREDGAAIFNSAYDGLPTVVLPSSSEKPEAPAAPAAPAPKAEPEQGAGMTQTETQPSEASVTEAIKAKGISFAEPPNEYVKEAWVKGVPGEREGFVYFGDNYVVDPRQLPDGAIIGEDFQSYALPIGNKWKSVFIDIDGLVKTSPALTPDLEAAVAERQAKEKSAPEAPPTQPQPQPQTKPEDASKNQVEETGGTPPVESQPPQTRPEGEAQEGASQRGREGEERVLTPEKAAPGVEPGAAAPAPAPTKAQPKAPTEPAETPEQVGIANAAVDVAREALGLPPIERPVQEVYGDDQVWADAESAMTAEPDRARYLVKSLIESPRQASTLETAILLRETVARTARLQQASIELVNATPENKESARQKYDDAVMALTEVQEASALAGAEQGRAFRARRFLADLNYNLAAMTTTLQGAHQRKLTDAEVAEVMAQSEKINKALKEVNDLKDSAGAVAEEESIFAEAVKEAQAEARLNAKEAISTAKSEIKSGKSVMEVINEKRDAARARLRKRGGSLNVGLNPADLVDYAIIAASYIAEGAVTLKDVTVKMVKEFGAAIEQHMPKIFSEAQVLKSELDNVAVEEPSEAAEKPKGKKPAIEQLREDGEISGRLVYEMVKEKVKSGLTTLDEVFKAVTADVQTVVPEITERELRDLFSGYGKVKFPSQEELPKKVRELRRLAQLASAIEDAQNKIAPLRSGPQRDEASLAVREAQKELHRIMKEQGIQRAPGPRALKSALDAAKTRLRNQIEELEKQVKERKRVPADKRDIIYDQETKDLIAKRDELQATLEEIDPPQPPTAQELIKKALKELDKTIAELEKKVKERDISKPATTETPITEQIQVKRDQRDALRRQLKDIRIEIEGEPYLTQEQVNERAERNLTRQIDELQRQIDEKDFEQSQGQKPENTAAIIRLKARRDTLREQRDILKEQTLGKKVKSEAERIDIAVKALEKSIDNLNERIRKGEVMPKAREDKTPQVAKVRNLRAERDSLRSVLTQMRKAQEEAAKDPEAEQLRRDRQYLESQIKNYQKKLASGDFRPQPKKAKEYSNKLAAKTLELQKLKEEWAEKVFIAQLNSRGKAAKAYDFVKQVLHTSRSVLTSFDVSAVFRQGGFIALGNPIRAFRNLKPMFESLASERAAQRTKDELESRPNFKLYQQSKLYLADFNQLAMNQQEEAFMSRWLNKIPKALGGGIIRGSQRAYVTFLNRLRADTFDAMLGSLQKGPEPTTEEIKAIADYINIATGRGDLGKFQQAGEALNTVFFAPRLVASRFQILGGYPYFKASGRTKNLVLREYAKFLTGAALVYAIGMALQDEEDKAVEIDPRSSDFLKLRYGDTRVDPLGGLIQASVFLSRVVSGEKKQLSGKVVPIRDEYRLMNLFRESPRKDKVRYGADDTFDVGMKFLRSKFSPSFGAAVDILTGETVVGEKTTPTEVGYKMVMPITFGEAKETLEAHGMPAGPALTIVSLFGMGVQTYD